MTGKIYAYFSTDDAPPGLEAVTHWFNGDEVQVATAFGSTPEEARRKLQAFLDAEIEKERKKQANRAAIPEKIAAAKQQRAQERANARR